MNLKKFAKNVYSQNGEDGIIEEVLKRLEIKTGQFCEFGAWDGKHLSNTYNLLSKNWSGVYIEGDRIRFNDLLKTAENKSIIPINKYIEVDGENSLDNILKTTNLKKDFEILSIDIDSYDYQVWESLKNYEPKIVIIEVNSGIEPPKLQIHGEKQGSSFQSTLNLGNSKGYDLVCHTGNMIFIKKELIKDLFENVNSSKLFDRRFL